MGLNVCFCISLGYSNLNNFTETLFFFIQLKLLKCQETDLKLWFGAPMLRFKTFCFAQCDIGYIQ